MYSELLIFPSALTNESILPDKARVLVSKACENFPIDLRIFGRETDG